MESFVECVPNVYKLMVPLSFVPTHDDADAFAKKTWQNCTVRIGTMQFCRLQSDRLDLNKIVKRERKFGMSTLGVLFLVAMHEHGKDWVVG
jgi:hypothetical protein